MAGGSRFRAVRTDDRVKVLHLGAGRRGHFQLPQYPDAKIVTLDADPRVDPDIVCRLGEDPIPLEDDSIDHATAIHVLEHIGRQGSTREWFYFWEEIYRVLKPGAPLYFESPLYFSVWAWADPSHVRALSPESFLYLSQDSYRLGGAISPFRIQCDFRSAGFTPRRDSNPEIAAREEFSHFSGTLRTVKPLVPWWTDEKVSDAICEEAAH